MSYPETDQWRAGLGYQDLLAERDLILNAIITQPFGPTDLVGEPAYLGYKNFHQGDDIVKSLPGKLPTAVPNRADFSGVVEAAGWHGGYGNAVVIRSPTGWRELIGHNSTLYSGQTRGGDPDITSPLTQPGQHVYAGQIVGWQGTTGYSTGVHEHLELRDPAGRPQDPGHTPGQLLGSLQHGLGWGGGYQPGHYDATPVPDAVSFQTPVPVPLQTGRTWNPTDPASQWTGEPLPAGWTVDPSQNKPYGQPVPPGPGHTDPGGGVPLPPGSPPPSTPPGYFPPTGQPVSWNPSDPFGFNAGLATIGPGLALGGVGVLFLVMGMWVMFKDTGAGKAATQVVVTGVKDAGKAVAVS